MRVKAEGEGEFRRVRVALGRRGEVRLGETLAARGNQLVGCAKD